MSHPALTRDLITQTALWRLVILMDASAMHVALRPPVDTEPLIYRRYPLDADPGAVHRPVQEILYDNPLLLSDFKSVDILIDSPDTLLAPSVLVRETGIKTLLSAAGDQAPGDDLLELAECTLYGDISILYSIPSALANFLRRTYFNTCFSSIFKPLAEWRLANLLKGLTIWTSAFGRALYIVVTEGGTLLSINKFTGSLEDWTYYILATRQNMASSFPSEPLIAIQAGQDELANALASTGLPTVTAHFSPALARLGKDAPLLPPPIAAKLSLYSQNT